MNNAIQCHVLPFPRGVETVEQFAVARSGSFDDIATLARTYLEADAALVVVCPPREIWRAGARRPVLATSISAREGEEIALIARDEMHRLADPLIAQDHGFDFYLMVPLRSIDGVDFGSLTVLNRAARGASDREISALRALGRILVESIELRSLLASARIS